MPAPHHKPQLRLIQGGLNDSFRLGHVRLRLAAMEAQAPGLDAVVIEDDTYLVLGAAPVMKEPAPSLFELERELDAFEPATPGSVLVRDGTPLELLAIVHALEYEPSWREDWIATAIDNMLAIAVRRRLGTVAMPMLGTVHGRLPAERFVALLCAAISTHRPSYPRLLWLAVPRATLESVRQQLQRETARRSNDGMDW